MLPRVIRQQAVVGSGGPTAHRGVVGGSDRPRRREGDGRRFEVLVEVQDGSDARYLIPIWREHDHGRVSADLVPFAELLRAGIVAVEVHRDE